MPHNRPAQGYPRDRMGADGITEPLPRALVIGGDGELASLMAVELLRRGFEVSAMAVLASELPDGARAVVGEITDTAAVESALSGVDAVVIAIDPGSDQDAAIRAEALHHGGVEHVIDGADGAGLRVVLVTQARGAELDGDLRLEPVPVSQAHGERTLRASSLAYTIVQPCRLTDTPGGLHDLVLEQDEGVAAGRIGRADVAAVCAEALLAAGSPCTTFVVYEGDAGPTHDWTSAFSALRRDPVRS